MKLFQTEFFLIQLLSLRLLFYQYQMDSANGFSVLQVVRNPGRALPYIACILMTIGLLWQFLAHLGLFSNRRSSKA